MSRTKDEFIKATGGFRLGESQAAFLQRSNAIAKLEAKLKSGRVPLDKIDDLTDEIRRLKGLPSVEWDYDNNND